MYYKDVEYHYEVNESLKIKFTYVGKRFLPLLFKFNFKRPTFKDGKEIEHKWVNRFLIYDCFRCDEVSNVYSYINDDVSYYINYHKKYYGVVGSKMPLKANLKLKNKLSLL